MLSLQCMVHGYKSIWDHKFFFAKRLQAHLLLNCCSWSLVSHVLKVTMPLPNSQHENNHAHKTSCICSIFICQGGNLYHMQLCMLTTNLLAQANISKSSLNFGESTVIHQIHQYFTPPIKDQSLRT